MEPLISIVIFLAVIALICGVLIYIIRMLPLPSPWGRIAEATILVIALLLVLQKLLVIV